MEEQEEEDEVEVTPPGEPIDAATQVSHRLTPSTKNSSKFGSDNGIPAYMQVKAAFASMLKVQRENSFNLSSGRPVFYRPPPPAAKWQVRKNNPNEWRDSNIDSAYGSLYTMKPETVAEPGELPEQPSTYRKEEEGEFFTGIDYHYAREKSYIRRTSLDMQSPVPGMVEQRRFSDHIIQGYNKPKRREVPGYGAPHNFKLVEEIKDTNDVVEMVVRPPSSFNVMPKRQKPAKCDRPSMVSCEFCEVLGPLSCHECIESTNRRIAHDVEHAAFPEVACTTSSLVAPTLSHLMSKGEKVVRKKKVHHGRVDTIIEPAFNKMKTNLVLPPIDNAHSSQNGNLPKALTTRTFGRTESERELSKRSRGITKVYQHQYEPQQRTTLPAISGIEQKNTFARVKRNIAGI